MTDEHIQINGGKHRLERGKRVNKQNPNRASQKKEKKSLNGFYDEDGYFIEFGEMSEVFKLKVQLALEKERREKAEIKLRENKARQKMKDSFQKRVNEKNKKIIQLKEQVKNLKKNQKTKPREQPYEYKNSVTFSKWVHDSNNDVYTNAEDPTTFVDVDSDFVVSLLKEQNVDEFPHLAIKGMNWKRPPSKSQLRVYEVKFKQFWRTSFAETLNQKQDGSPVTSKGIETITSTPEQIGWDILNRFLNVSDNSFIAYSVLTSLKEMPKVRKTDIKKAEMKSIKPTFMSLFGVELNKPKQEGLCVPEFLYNFYHPYTREGGGRKLPNFTMENLISILDKARDSRIQNGEGEIVIKSEINPMLDEVVHGYSPEDIVAFCDKYGLTMYGFDVTGGTFLKHVPAKRCSGVPSLLFVSDCEHCYPITDPNWRKKLCERNRDNKNGFIPKKEGEHISHFNNKLTITVLNEDDVDMASSILDDETIRDRNIIVLTECVEPLYIQYMTKHDKILNNSGDFSYSNVFMSRFSIKDRNIHVWANRDFNIVMECCEKLGIDFDNQNLVTLALKLGIEKGLSLPKSILNDEVRHVFEHQISRRAFVSQFENKRDINVEKLQAYDYVKYYSSMAKKDVKWLSFDLFSEVEECPDTLDLDDMLVLDDTCLYYVETDNHFPLQYDNWYYVSELEHARECGIHFTIKKRIRSSAYRTMPMAEFIDHVYAHLGGKLGKSTVNPWIGMLNKIRSSSFRGWFCNNPENAGYLYFTKCTGDKGFVSEIETGHNRTYYRVGNYSKKEIEMNYQPIYTQLIHLSWVYLHRLYKRIEMAGTNVKLIALKTDCVIFESDSKIELPCGDRVGDIQTVDVKKLKFKANRDQHDKQYILGKVTERIERVAQTMSIPTRSEGIELEVEDEMDTYAIVEQILALDSGCFITGRAGTGKSHISKAILEKLGNAIRSMAFTNNASRIVNGETFHSTFFLKVGDDIRNAKFHKVKNCKYLLVDEISLLPSYLYNLLYLCKKRYGTKIIIVGDFDQLPPVEERTGLDYRNSEILKYLTDGNSVVLRQNKRCDVDGERMWELCSDILDRNVDVATLFPIDMSEPLPEENHIAYTNKACRLINKKCAKVFSFLQDKLKLPSRKRKSGKRIHGYTICTGMPMYSTTNSRKFGFRNNEQFHVMGWNDNYVVLKKPDESEIAFPIELMTRNFVQGFCSTCHRTQGRTLRGKLRIWEFENKFVTKNWLYTAITRTTNPNDIFLSCLE